MIKKKNQAHARPQCKDLETATILLRLQQRGLPLPGIVEPCFRLKDLEEALPEVPEKLVLAKWRQLFKLGFLDSKMGCSCGCSTLTRLTEKGRLLLDAPSTPPPGVLV